MGIVSASSLHEARPGSSWFAGVYCVVLEAVGPSRQHAFWVPKEQASFPSGHFPWHLALQFLSCSLPLIKS